jgi:hypothetical protein
MEDFIYPLLYDLFLPFLAIPFLDFDEPVSASKRDPNSDSLADPDLDPIPILPMPIDFEDLLVLLDLLPMPMPMPFLEDFPDLLEEVEVGALGPPLGTPLGLGLGATVEGTPDGSTDSEGARDGN